MPVTLTCDCGARFEVEDLLSGQKVSCPECQQAIEARGRLQTAPRTSLLALFSLVLALVGALTLAGTLAAIVVGIVALVHIRRRQGQLTGRNHAIAGIVLGVVFTALTVLLLSQRDRLPIGAWVRQRTLTGQITGGPPQVSSRDGVCTLTLASSEWARVRTPTSGDPSVDDLQKMRDVLLVNVRLHAYLDVARDVSQNPLPLSSFDHALKGDLQPARPPLIGEDEETPRPPNASSKMTDRALEPIDGYEGHEWVFHLDRGGQSWRCLVRAYRKKGTPPRPPLYIIRAYAPRRRFDAGEEELRRVLDSVRFPP